jgi:hypothetical protein
MLWCLVSTKNWFLIIWRYFELLPSFFLIRSSTVHVAIQR